MSETTSEAESDDESSESTPSDESSPSDSGGSGDDGGSGESGGGSSGQNSDTDSDDSVGISDDQLPEDLQPTDDNPLAKPPSDEDDEDSGMSLDAEGQAAEGAPPG
jgi:hypothetical protein